VTETGRYLYDQQTVTAVKAYLHWRDLGYPQAEIRRMFQHRFKRSTDDPAPSEEADR
jgi:DNA-binding transcriptional MerR regulator